MQVYTNKLIYPEGDEIEINFNPEFNQIVDLNGYPVILPIPSPKMIIYRVYRVSIEENRGLTTKNYYLELVIGRELQKLARPSF